MQARSIGFYTHGCLAGGVALPINGKTWQVMRLSRNRNWGHPDLVAFLERLAAKVPKVRLARAAGRRHGAAARRADAHRPRQPSGRARCRHLAHADAEDAADARGARGDVGDQRGRRGQEGRRSEDLDAGPFRADQGGGRGPEGRAHLRQCGDQEGAVPRGRQGPRLAAQGAPVVGAQLSFPCPHRLPGRQPGCKAQDPAGETEGCGKELDCWFSPGVLNPPPPKEPPKPRPPLTMADLPAACRQVLLAP